VLKNRCALLLLEELPLRHQLTVEYALLRSDQGEELGRSRGNGAVTGCGLLEEDRPQRAVP
jgi:hypothetical protein